jgi:hypothetical protein
LQGGAVSLCNDCSDRGIDEQACVQRYGYAVADVELALIIWLFANWHGKEFTPS